MKTVSWISALSKVVIGAWEVIGSKRTNEIAPNRHGSLFFSFFFGAITLLNKNSLISGLTQSAVLCMCTKHPTNAIAVRTFTYYAYTYKIKHISRICRKWFIDSTKVNLHRTATFALEKFYPIEFEFLTRTFHYYYCPQLYRYLAEVSRPVYRSPSITRVLNIQMDPVGEVLQKWRQSSDIPVPTGAMDREAVNERFIAEEVVDFPARRHG